MTTCRKRTDHRPMDGHDPKCANLRALPILEMRLAKVMLLSFDSLYFHRQFLCNVVNRFSSIAVFAGASMLAFLFDEVA
jgi:hypothetical protein